jgi:hypothetical protein
MHKLANEHRVLIKCILCYLCGLLNKGLLLYHDSPLTLHGFFDFLHVFSDVDWVGNKDDYSSTSAYLVYLGCNLVSWSSKKQPLLLACPQKQNTVFVATTDVELYWVYSLLLELGIGLPNSIVVYCDNVGATQLSFNPIFYSRMKHVVVDYHCIRDQVQSDLLRVAHVSSIDQLTNILIKSLPTSQFLLFQDKIGISTRDAS